MEFKNDTGRDVMIQTDVNKGTWITVDKGETVELSERAGRIYGLTPVVKAVESKAGPAIVETKKVETKKKVAEEKIKLVAINGVDEQIADALLLRFNDIKGIIKAGIKGIIRIPGIGKSRANKIIRDLSKS